MSARIRRFAAAFAASLMLSSAALPASAYIKEEHANTPVVFDAMIMRPIGFMTFLFGTALFTISLPLVAVTRPQDIDKPFDALVAKPAGFVWKDQLGGH